MSDFINEMISDYENKIGHAIYSKHNVLSWQLLPADLIVYYMTAGFESLINNEEIISYEALDGCSNRIKAMKAQLLLGICLKLVNYEEDKLRIFLYDFLGLEISSLVDEMFLASEMRVL